MVSSHPVIVLRFDAIHVFLAVFSSNPPLAVYYLYSFFLPVIDRLYFISYTIMEIHRTDIFDKWIKNLADTVGKFKIDARIRRLLGILGYRFCIEQKIASRV